MHDIVIRNGTVIDGTGRAAFQADVAIGGDRIVEVGSVAGKGREEIDATGRIVTPGFVDIHTHYDGQATWDPWMAPSSFHGVTTIVMGNCGVGFAPVRPDKHDWLINLMEGVEDIPGSALAEGLSWDWETFPEYLDVLGRGRFTMDIGTHIPHAALRSYVMGDRALTPNPPTEDEIQAMARAVEDGVRAGALGFSTSRATAHKARTGELTPSIWAEEAELRAIFEALARTDKNSVFEVTAEISTGDSLGMCTKLSRETGVRVSFSVAQMDYNPEEWRGVLRQMEEARAQNVNIGAQIMVRFVGILLNWRASIHPFMFKPSWTKIAALPWEDQLERLRDPQFRRQMIDEPSVFPEKGYLLGIKHMVDAYEKMFFIGEEELDYEPRREDSLAARAEREGRHPAEIAYDALMSEDGNGFLLEALMNYSYCNYDHVFEMFGSDITVVSLSDGGAHVGTICDASMPTFVLTHWARDRKRGPTLSLEDAVRRQTSGTANYYGLTDRGVLASGYLADLNVIDFDNLKLEKPYLAFDLPAGGKRLLQRATGYTATIKSGVVVARDGAFTGALPGRLLRGRN